MPPNFTLLDSALPDVSRLVAAMVQACDAVDSRSWSHPQEPTTEEWGADVLADPRARTRIRRRSEQMIDRTFYMLADEPREVILVACSKCKWKAACQPAELIAAHGASVRCPAWSISRRRAVPKSAHSGIAAACITLSGSSGPGALTDLLSPPLGQLAAPTTVIG
jgi:hypothetical protein